MKGGYIRMTVWEELGGTFLTSILSIIVLFLITKISGNRQMAQLSLFDYINGITIGSIAAELATNLEGWYKTTLALILYGLITASIAVLTNKSVILRRFIEGHSFVIYENDILYEKNLSRSHLDIDEFLTLCRNQGYFDLQDVHSAILEPNGKLSIIPKSYKRPTTPEDFGLNPTQDFPLATVIIDGHILYRNLKTTGNDEKWLLKQIHAKGIKDIKQIMFATCSVDGQVEVYEKSNKERKQDIFE